MHNTVAILLIALALAGCAVGPEYRAPEAPVAARFGQDDPRHFNPTEPEDRWWALFDDPVLDDLVQRAVRGNPDVRVATARVNEARALRRESLWAFGPQGGFTGGFQRRQFAQPEFNGLNLPAGVVSTWATGFDATWEIDVFGRLRRSAEASNAELGVAEAQLRDVLVVLLAEVAGNYFGLQGARESLDLLVRQKALLERSLETTRNRVTAGRGSPLDAARAEALLKETESLLPVVQRELAGHQHRIAVLIGEAPAQFEVPRMSRSGSPTVRTLAIGTPAELLRRRPDIAAAERQLAGAIARVGVQTAEMFPEVSVSGFIRLIGGEGVSLGSAASQAWGVAPTATWHLLNLGRLNALRKASRFQADGRLADYDRTVLRALEDMENSLVRYRAAEERLRLLMERQMAAERALGIAQAQYGAGAIGSLEATDAERTALLAQRETVNAVTEHRLAVVAVYKALGGGWAALPQFSAR